MTLPITSVGLLDAAQVRSALEAAVLAPSIHNTQPWLFRCTADGIELHADPGRALSVADADRRGLMLSCGAALFNLRVAVQALGVHPAITLLPRRDEPNLLAMVKPFGARRPDPRLVPLAAAIPRRHTNRTPFTRTRIPRSLTDDLRRAAEAEQAWLPRLDTRQLDQLRELTHKAHHQQLADPAFLREWRHWTGRDAQSQDGVPHGSGGTSPAMDGGWALRDYGGQRPPSGDSAEHDDPFVVILGSFDDTTLDRLRTGQAMQRVLLTATAAGLEASFVSQPVEIAAIRAELRALLGGGLWPQIVLRLGHGTPASWTRRRPLADVLLTPGT